MYADLTVKNPSFLKRFSHSKRFDMALELLALGADEKVLDYGTADGYMLIKLLSKNPKLVVGYEPEESQFKQLQTIIRKIPTNKVLITDDLTHLPQHEFDKICCLEVLEHLTEKNQRTVLYTLKRLISNKGTLVISVPIEVGLSSLFKNLARWVLNQRDTNATSGNVIKSLFGLKIKRENQAYIYGHIGFDYRNLEKIFNVIGLKIQKRYCSPFRAFGCLMNSQVLYTLRKITSH